MRDNDRQHIGHAQIRRIIIAGAHPKAEFWDKRTKADHLFDDSQKPRKPVP
jgi:hypothetical protein